MRVGTRPGAHEGNNVLAFLERHRSALGDREALRWAPEGSQAGLAQGRRVPHRSMTYAALASRIGRFAQGLLDLGVRPGDRALIFLPMGQDLYTAMFAVQRIGAIATFLDSWARADQVGAVLARVQPAAMATTQAAFDRLGAVPGMDAIPLRIVSGATTAAPAHAPAPGRWQAHAFDDVAQAPQEAPVAPVRGDTTALVTFTTGSSGTPKGANRTHRFLAAQHEALSRVVPYTPHDVDFPAFPIFSLNSLATGVTTVMPAIDLARPSAADGAILAAQMRQEGVTSATLSPSMLVAFTAHARQAQASFPHLRRLVTGGAPISADDLRAFYAVCPEAEAWVLYGSTEVEPMAHIEGREMLAQAPDPDPDVVPEGVDVGAIADGLEARFVRPARGPIDLDATPWEALLVPPGEVGEFLVSGDHVCRDYYNDPEAFRQAKVRDADGRVWHRTGDLAYLRDGHLWIVGRVHNAFTRAGRALFPVRAEIVLKRVAGVRQAAYLGLPDPGLGERAAVALVLEPGRDAAAAALEARRLLSKNGLPADEVRVLDAIPMDPRHHSKVEYAALRARLAAGEGVLA